MGNINQLLDSKELIVYGAGSVAKHILPYLISVPDIDIIAIAVSGEVPDGATLSGIPLCSLYTMTEHRNTTILVATSDCFHQEMRTFAQNLGFDNIVLLTEQLRDSFMEYSCGRFLENLNINISEDVINVCGTKIIAPQVANVKNADNILSQVAELIIPSLMNNYSMVVEGPYEFGAVKLCEGDVVLDCGANMGTFSAYAAYKNCQVYAFEPTLELCPLVEQHIELNGGCGTVIKEAVSDKSGKTYLYENLYNCGGNSIVSKASGMTREIPCTTIDETVAKLGLSRVDFIKADIEGAERLMLEGAAKTLKEFAPKLAICTYHLPDDPEVLEHIIKRINPQYQVVHKWQKLYAWVE